MNLEGEVSFGGGGVMGGSGDTYLVDYFCFANTFLADYYDFRYFGNRPQA